MQWKFHWSGFIQCMLPLRACSWMMNVIPYSFIYLWKITSNNGINIMFKESSKQTNEKKKARTEHREKIEQIQTQKTCARFQSMALSWFWCQQSYFYCLLFTNYCAAMRFIKALEHSEKERSKAMNKKKKILKPNQTKPSTLHFSNTKQ